MLTFAFTYRTQLYTYTYVFGLIRRLLRFGSITQSSTIKLGSDDEGNDFYIPLSSLLPMVNPNDIIVDGWDISSADLATAMQRARVLDYNLQEKLIPLMKDMKPKPSIYWPDFIAANQVSRNQ